MTERGLAGACFIALGIIHAKCKRDLPHSKQSTKSVGVFLFLANMANMEDLAFKALTAIKGGTPTETKLKQLAVLKAEIKHRHCPEPAVAPLFDVVRASISTPLLTTAGFSILVHLMKRLQVQGNNSLLQIQGVKTYPCLLERLADQREPVRNRAIQALTEFHAISAPDVEQFVRDKTLTCRSPKAKESGMQWVTTVRCKNMDVPSFANKS